MGSIKKQPRAILFACIANTISLGIYLVWLAAGGRDSLFFDRDGILGLLPIIPIVFVYIYVARKQAPKP